MGSSGPLNSVLEALWGIEARLNHAGKLPYCSLRSPRDFVVVEPPPRASRGPWILFLARKEGIDTITLMGRAKKLLGAQKASSRGLKDACSISYQYIALYTNAGNGGLAGKTLEGPGFRLYHVCSSGPLKPRTLPFNLFLLKPSTDDPETLCDNISRLECIPGFYGPQRFGIERPNTHIVALLTGESRLGDLLREYRFRYPLEARSKPGAYEARAIEEASRALSPFKTGRPPAIVLEALQSYLFNRALSTAIRDGSLERYGETGVTVENRGILSRVPAARLPSPKLRSSGSSWARLVSYILEEEGLNWTMLRGLKPRIKPLKYPIIVTTCRKTRDSAVIALSLPRGAYATIALREACDVDWLGYCRQHWGTALT